MTTTQGTTPSGVSAPRFPSPQWWIRDRDGEVAIAQPPNPALVVWLVTVVVGWTHLLDDRRTAVVGHVGQGALLAWALDELLRGASPVRRLLGAVVLVGVLWRILG
jgi:hypothetical protein